MVFDKLFSRTSIYLIVILFFAFLIRFVGINNSPPALYGDELTMVYDTYSVLKTGKDQKGVVLPITFEMGAGRPGGYIYGSLPFVYFFGPTALGVRGLSILSGILLIVVSYFLGKKLFSQKIALVIAFVMAISPWDIQLSRGGFEAHFALFLALIGTYLFIIAEKKPFFYILVAFCFGLTIHTYPTYKLSLIFFLPLLIWFSGGFRKLISSNKGELCVAAAVFLIFGLVGVFQSLYGGSETRFSNINLFSIQDINQSITQKVNSERTLNNMPASISSIFHNKEIEYLKILGESYTKNLSIDFLFLHGDKNPRHNMSNIGEFYLVDLFLIILGSIYLFRFNKKLFTFLFGWILLAPIPTALLLEPHALRNSFMLVPLVILSALGVSSLWFLKNKLHRFLILSFIVILLVGQFSFFVDKLFFLSPNLYARFWSYPAKMASEIILENREKYDYILVSDRIDNIEFGYPVYARVDPADVISQNKEKSSLNNFQFKRFNNVYIGYIPAFSVISLMQSLPGKVLYIGSIDDKNYLTDFHTFKDLDMVDSLVITQKL